VLLDRERLTEASRTGNDQSAGIAAGRSFGQNVKNFETVSNALFDLIVGLTLFRSVRNLNSGQTVSSSSAGARSAETSGGNTLGHMSFPLFVSVQSINKHILPWGRFKINP
jgi:hypothetical protein